MSHFRTCRLLLFRTRFEVSEASQTFCPLNRCALAGERIAIRRYLADLDQRATDLGALETALAERAMKDERARRLMTLSGVHVTVAMGLLAAIGDITRFVSSEKLVSYLGLNPSVRQSGNRPAQHGRITKQGRSHARAMLVEAAWAAARAPGPLRAFFLRIQSRRGKQVAAVATAPGWRFWSGIC
jgi:transposase